MNYQEKIATKKAERAMQFLGTGAKIGGNYIKYYTKKIINGDTGKAALHQENAEDIYDTLSDLKGSALKVAQMLSMDKGILPQEYTEKFALSQYAAKPLSGPLVVKTFQKYFDKKPQEIFDTFETNANNAASIGQVHKATLNGEKLAVKIQYPGIAQSIESDLKIVKPIAKRMFDITEKEIEKYFAEVKDKLIEETNYSIELERSIFISDACKHIANIYFPKYYPNLSSDKILTMQWLEGSHLKEFLEKNPSQEIKNQIGQALWDFYNYQMHELKLVHADPHPGNFLLSEKGEVGVIDFGCVKEIPLDFYNDYFALILPEIKANETLLNAIMNSLEMTFANDTPRELLVFKEAFNKMTDLLATPFKQSTFDFGNDAYINSIYAMGEEISKNDEIRNSKVARGSKHMLYINRTYFGLYALLHELKANINTGIGKWGKNILDSFE